MPEETLLPALQQSSLSETPWKVLITNYSIFAKLALSSSGIQLWYLVLDIKFCYPILLFSFAIQF